LPESVRGQLAPLATVSRNDFRESRDERVRKARDLFCFLAVRRLGYSGVEAGELLGLKRSAVSQAVRRGELEGEHELDGVVV